MEPVEIFFCFKYRPPWREMWAARDFYQAFGHVEAFGYTVDETWFFFDPNRKYTSLKITHLHDEVSAMMAEFIGRADLVLAVKPTGRLAIPPLHPATCAATCGHLAGIRAFTVRGLARKLRAINAREVKDENPQGRPERQGGSGAGAPDFPA